MRGRYIFLTCDEPLCETDAASAANYVNCRYLVKSGVFVIAAGGCRRPEHATAATGHKR
jgi:hypothetical protein